MMNAPAQQPRDFASLFGSGRPEDWEGFEEALERWRNEGRGMSEHDAIEQAWHEYHGPIKAEGEEDYFPALPPLFKRGFLDGVKRAKRERDEAREIIAAALSILPCGHIPSHTPASVPDRIRQLLDSWVTAEHELEKAVDFAKRLERERDDWKSESLEQAKLLAMSADREEKLRAEIVGWENKWRCAVEMAALAEMKLHDVNVAKQ
jgi:hypothetical protein